MKNSCQLYINIILNRSDRLRMSINISSIFLILVLVLGFASYPSALSDLGQDITNSQLPLGNVAFAQEETKVELTEEVGISDVESEEETEEETEEEAEEEAEVPVTIVDDNGGGCLIATATYGSEMAPQVQQLREIRDNSLLQTESGRYFMESFNQFYYSFSPTIADLERENPIFKEVVKLTITPLLSSLSLLNYVDMNSESEVLGYGISLILLNVGMYFVLPAIVIHRVRKF